MTWFKIEFYLNTAEDFPKDPMEFLRWLTAETTDRAYIADLSAKAVESAE